MPISRSRAWASTITRAADRDSFGYANGCVPLPTKPGLGVELNEEKIVEAAKVGHGWKNPVWRNADGTVAEW